MYMPIRSVSYGIQVTAAELGLSRAVDEDLLKEAEKLGRILVTRDRDYGNLVFVRKIGAGVIYLRMLPSTRNDVHKKLAGILEKYDATELEKAFVVVESKGHRIRRIR